MKNFIFVSILLALLLTVNAAPFQPNKRVLSFHPCNLQPHVDYIDVIGQPNTPVSRRYQSFFVFGKLTEHNIIANQTVLYIEYQHEQNGSKIGREWFSYFNTSINAGHPFNRWADDVPTPTLPRSYLLVVIVGRLFSNSVIPFGCAQSLG
ncbi:hypothetical protein C2G38_2234786 [Gigaspora rosea]|uniref:Uncharacterized protein n=1 Tax=Gigaspora rosea TaxID=44941 RepID=A0A397TQP7_9GLOM|nr:hypothetical protein C2G38_2234786 [Gigaspora rosea]